MEICESIQNYFFFLKKMMKYNIPNWNLAHYLLLGTPFIEVVKSKYNVYSV